MESKFEHRESSTAKIYFSKEYGKFSFIKGNRDISQTRVNKMVKAYHRGINIFMYCPILVYEGATGKMYIIDGQHRFMASRDLKLHVYYTVVRDFNLHEIADINSCMANWKNSDYQNCYIDVGIEPYKILKAFIEKHHVPISTATTLLMHGNVSGGNCMKAFKDGKLEIKFEKKAEELMFHMHKFEKIAIDGYDRSLLDALCQIEKAKKVTLDDLYKKLSDAGLKIDRKKNGKTYVLHIEELYNHHKSKRVYLT